jgi:hypothetical protein
MYGGEFVLGPKCTFPSILTIGVRWFSPVAGIAGCIPPVCLAAALPVLTYIESCCAPVLAATLRRLAVGHAPSCRRARQVLGTARAFPGAGLVRALKGDELAKKIEGTTIS